MRNVLLLTVNTLKLELRKKFSFVLMILFPVLGVLLSINIYGNAGTGSLKIAVIDNDHSTISQNMVNDLGRQQQFKISAASAKDVSTTLSSGKADCVLMIPAGFAQDIYQNKNPQVELVSIKGKSATAWVESTVNLHIRNLSDIARASGGDRETFDKIYANLEKDKTTMQVRTIQDQSTSKGITSQSIGFLIMFMMIGAGNTTEMILKEKRERTYFRILSAPVSGRTYVAGNVLAGIIQVMLQVLILLVLMTRVFKIQTFVPFYQLFLILVLFGLVAIGLGLLIVAFSGDTSQANALQNLIITPTCLLAGCFWPMEIMPKAIQKMADFTPQKWAIGAIKALQSGNSFGEITSYLVIIVAFALAFFLIAAYKLGRNNSISNYL